MNRIKMLREAKGLGLRELAADLEKRGTPLSWMTINKEHLNPLCFNGCTGLTSA